MGWCWIEAAVLHITWGRTVCDIETVSVQCSDVAPHRNCVEGGRPKLGGEVLTARRSELNWIIRIPRVRIHNNDWKDKTKKKLIVQHFFMNFTNGTGIHNIFFWFWFNTRTSLESTVGEEVEAGEAHGEDGGEEEGGEEEWSKRLLTSRFCYPCSGNIQITIFLPEENVCRGFQRESAGPSGWRYKYSTPEKKYLLSSVAELKWLNFGYTLSLFRLWSRLRSFTVTFKN